jgi:acetoin utilization deacetylase AcuC-like enzyme
MKIIYSETHKNHNPPFEGFTTAGNLPAFEVPARAEEVLCALKKRDWAEIANPQDFGLDSILAVHSQPYLAYLQTAYDKWSQYSPVDGMAFIPGTHGIDHENVVSGKVSEEYGFFLMDTTVGISAGTYSAAVQSAFTALTAAREAAENCSAAFALCRPPGHHAGREVCGGYCFLNNAAIAAQWLSKIGKVAILDIDYHAGNGTQEIFYNRQDVLVISIHADPSLEYPRYAGAAAETGSGSGMGYHKNFPLPPNIEDQEYLVVLDCALSQIKAFDPQYLVVSAGMDIYKEDPLGKFKITQQGIHAIGLRIAASGLPTVVIMEGGYHLPTLGENFANLLSPLGS